MQAKPATEHDCPVLVAKHPNAPDNQHKPPVKAAILVPIHRAEVLIKIDDEVLVSLETEQVIFHVHLQSIAAPDQHSTDGHNDLKYGHQDYNHQPVQSCADVGIDHFSTLLLYANHPQIREFQLILYDALFLENLLL